MGVPLYKKALRKLREVGFWATLKIIVARLAFLLRVKFGPAHIRFRLEEHAFDRKYSTDTKDLVAASTLDVSEDKLGHAHGYEPTSIRLFNEILQELPISYQDYILVDFGSGKGRTLLLASNFPFKKIIGVEFSPRLNEIACNNIRIYKSESQKCYNLESLCVDANDFEIPDEKAVFYFFNPFDEHVMRAVLSNIKASLKKYPREIFIVYANPVYHELMNQAPFLKFIGEGRGYFKRGHGYSIYTNKNLS